MDAFESCFSNEIANAEHESSAPAGGRILYERTNAAFQLFDLEMIVATNSRWLILQLVVTYYMFQEYYDERQLDYDARLHYLARITVYSQNCNAM